MALAAWTFMSSRTALLLRPVHEHVSPPAREGRLPLEWYIDEKTPPPISGVVT
jgi:hypothetical protein